MSGFIVNYLLCKVWLLGGWARLRIIESQNRFRFPFCYVISGYPSVPIDSEWVPVPFRTFSEVAGGVSKPKTPGIGCCPIAFLYRVIACRDPVPGQYGWAPCVPFTLPLVRKPGVT